MGSKKRPFTAEFKVRLALEALRDPGGAQAVAERHGLRVGEVSGWERQLRDGVAATFAGGGEREREAEIRGLQAKVDELGQERDFLRDGLEQLERTRTRRAAE